MIPDRDYYADKDGKLTDDPKQYARQIAVAGFALDERIARRYGISDTLVSVDEPNAPRRVTGGASIEIIKAEDSKDESEDQPQEPQKPAEAGEPEVAETKASVTVKKPAAKKEKRKK